jgi:hypothetical protein
MTVHMSWYDVYLARSFFESSIRCHGIRVLEIDDTSKLAISKLLVNEQFVSHRSALQSHRIEVYSSQFGDAVSIQEEP